jgi:hypothetical protein
MRSGYCAGCRLLTRRNESSKIVWWKCGLPDLAVFEAAAGHVRGGILSAHASITPARHEQQPVVSSGPTQGPWIRLEVAPVRIPVSAANHRGKSRNPLIFNANFGGERGIRTLEGLLTLTPLAGVRLRPLGHLSGGRNHNDPESGWQRNAQMGVSGGQSLPRQGVVGLVR